MKRQQTPFAESVMPNGSTTPFMEYPDDIEYPIIYIHKVNISANTPMDWALPLYGYVMPLLVILTTITNSFIIIVLSHKHLRTPTNTVLLAMAVTDLLTGCTSVPWVIYYYTLKGYEVDETLGLSTFWCKAHAYLFEILPSIFHTAAIWLTVFLAIQRYVYVCLPNTVHIYCTPKTTKVVIAIISLSSIFSVLPEFLGKQRLSQFEDNKWECHVTLATWIVKNMRKEVFYSLYYWSRVTLHFVPCCLLLVFTCKLGTTIKQAEIRKKSWATNVDTDRKISYPSRISGNNGCSGRSLYATNRMLSVICTWFLVLEIPAAMMYVLHFLVGNNFIPSSPIYFDFCNRLLIIRNILIVLASPFQFGIYCSMSEQFRLTVRQLFTSKLLYSLILVDVNTLEAKKRANSLRMRMTSSSSASTKESKKKMKRQSSFPEQSNNQMLDPNVQKSPRTYSARERSSGVPIYRKVGDTTQPALDVDT